MGAYVCDEERMVKNIALEGMLCLPRWHRRRPRWQLDVEASFGPVPFFPKVTFRAKRYMCASGKALPKREWSQLLM